MRYRLRALRNAIRFSTVRQRVLASLLAGLTLLFALAVFAGCFVMGTLRGEGEAGKVLAQELALSVFLFMLAGSVPFIAATLLHPGDVELLGAAPVRPRAVVFMRLLEGALAGAVQFGPVGAPAVAGTAVAMGASVTGLLLLLLPGALLILMPSCWTAVLLVLAVRLLGTSRVRSATALVYSVLGAFVCFVVVRQVMGMNPAGGLTALAAAEPNPTGPIARWPPWGWFGLAIYGAAKADYALFATAILPVLLVTIVGAFAAVRLGESVLEGGILAENGRARSGLPRRAGAGLSGRLSSPIVAVAMKELRYVLRDPLLLSQAGMPAILFFVPFIMYTSPAFRAQAGPDLVFAFACLMVLAVLYMQASVLSASSIGLEGRAFWVYLVSPNSLDTLLLAKWLVSTILSGGVACLMVVLAALAFHAELQLVAAILLVMIGSASALCGIGAGLSAALPRFTFENPAHRVSPLAMTLGFGAGVAYMGASTLALGAAWAGAVRFPDHSLLFWLGGWSFFAIVTLLATAGPMLLGAGRLNEMEWEH